MNTFIGRLLFVLFISSVSLGCTDALLSERPEATNSSGVAPQEGKLRNPQLLGRIAGHGTASKDGEAVDLFLAFNYYEADGVTRRVLDAYGVTRRVLQEYGVTRRVLDSYGITRRVLEEYGVTRRVLEEYGVTRRVLEEYGVTRRILDEYSGLITPELMAKFGFTEDDLAAQGVSRRILDEYNAFAKLRFLNGLTTEQFEALVEQWERSIKLKVRIENARPGIFVSLGGVALDVLLDEIAGDPDIAFAEPSAVISGTPLVRSRDGANLAEMIPWGIDATGAMDVNTGINPDQVRVYVLDSGVMKDDLNVKERKDFTMLFTDRQSEFWDEDDIVEMDYFDPGDKGNPDDENGHGSHIAGTIGAKLNGHGVIGMAPNVGIYSLKVLTAQGQTDVTTVVAALDYVIGQKQANPTKAMVVNLSLGMDTESKSYNVLDEAVERAAQVGIVVVVSAGNASSDMTTYSPAHVADAITVGAHSPGNAFSSFFSNFGPGVDLFAPGDLIPSLSIDAGDYDSGVAVLESGTSMAAAHVSGAAALLLAKNPTASPREIEKTLVGTAAQTLEGGPGGTTRAVLDVAKAFNRRLPPFMKFAIASGAELSVNGTLKTQPGSGEINASVYAAHYLAVGSGSDIKGFGYYGNSFGGSGTVYKPVFNPSKLPGALKTEVLDLPEIDLSKLDFMATKRTKGNEKISGQLVLGTLSSPTIWYVDGNVEFDGPTTVTGYGVIVSKGWMKISGNIMPADSDTGSLGLFSSGNMSISASKAEIGGTLYSRNSISVTGSLKLRGSIMVGSTLTLSGGTLEIIYQCPVPELMEKFWPLQGDLQSGSTAPPAAQNDASVDPCPDCNLAVFLNKAKWTSDGLDIEASGPPNSTLDLSSSLDGRIVGSVTTDATGRVDTKISSLTFVPCSVSLTSVAGQSATRLVEDPPVFCDAKAWIQFSKSEWRTDRTKLTLEGKAWDGYGDPKTRVSFLSDGRVIGRTTTNGGAFKLELAGKASQPGCTIQAVVEGDGTAMGVSVTRLVKGLCGN